MKLNKTVSILTLFLLFLNLSSFDIKADHADISTNEVPFLLVDDDYDLSTPGFGVYSFNKIQDAIDNASDGDTVFVFNGNYDCCQVLKNRLNIIGENRELTIIDGGGIYISSIGTRISNFTIINSDEGIEVHDSKYIIISNNIIKSNNYGIYLVSSKNNIISNNIIKENKKIGIGISSCMNDIIKNNEVSYSENGDGIYISMSMNISVIHNNIINNKHGIKINYEFSSETSEYVNVISRNNIKNNKICASSDSPKSYLYSRFYNNYWGRARIIPKFIWWEYLSFVILFPCNIDLRPALNPYDNQVGD